MNRTTILSPDRLYRYTLWREWPIEDLLCKAECSADVPADKYLMVIGLNPSTADETKDDPTIRKCVGFAKRWGYGALCMTNLFAWRATDPVAMKKVALSSGQDNHHHLLQCASKAGMVLAAWGKHGSHRHMDLTVSDWLSQVGIQLHCLKKNNDGSPMHPLYVPYETTPIIWTP